MPIETHRDCDDVQATARGGESDAPELRQHLALCSACRDAVLETRAVATLARDLLSCDRDPARVAALALAAARGPERALAWSGRLALAAASVAGFALIAVLGAQGPGLARPDPTAVAEHRNAPIATASVLPQRDQATVILRVQDPSAGRLPFELSTAHGTEVGELDLSPHYVLDTVPARAVLVDTF